MKQIKKVVLKAFGDESVLAVETSTIKDPRPDEVQIRVEYSPMTGADINMRMGTYPLQKRAPLTPGYSVVGTVEQNGSSSSQFEVGQRVAGLTVYDGQAELANVAERFLVPVSDGVDPKQALAIVLDWVTADQMLNRVAKIRSGDPIFIHGLSGSVGQALLILAKLKGAKIFGTASVRNHIELRKQGATPFVYTDKNWIQEMNKIGGAIAVFDPLGFQSFDESFSILKKHGRLVAYGMNLGAFTHFRPRHFLLEFIRLLSKNLHFWTQKHASFYGVRRDSKYYLPDLKALLALLKEGKITVPIKAIYPLEEIRSAHSSWGKSAGMGTTIIEI